MDNPVVIFAVMVLFMVLGAVVLNWDIRRQARKDEFQAKSRGAVASSIQAEGAVQ